MADTRRNRAIHPDFPVLAAFAAATVLGGLALHRSASGDEKPAAAQADAATLDELATIKQRILEPLLEPVDAAAVQRLVDTIQADGSWPGIDYHQRRRSAWTTTRHLSNVLLLARAYRAPGSKLCGNAELLETLHAGLDYWLEHDFQNPNWWWNRIGVPRTLAPILLLMEDDLSDAQREKGLQILRRAGIGMTGQNLVWVTEITALRGILEKDPKLVATAYARIAEEIRVTTGEGIQPDFSFHQHGACLYNHGYGAAFAGDCPRIATQVAGTRLAFPAEKITILSSLLLDGSQWMARGTASDFGAEGREITRHGQDAAYLATAARYMLQLTTGREQELRALTAEALENESEREVVLTMAEVVGDREHRRAGVDNDVVRFGGIESLELERVSAPALIIHGSADSDVDPEHGERAARQIHGAEHLVMNDGTHLSLFVHPDARAAQARVLELMRAGLTAS